MSTDLLIRHVVETTSEQVASGAVEAARVRMLDIVGCMIGGARAEGAAAVTRLAAGSGPRESTLFDGSGRAPAGQAAMANAVLARSFDFGVLTPTWKGREVWSHLSESSVPTALAVGERADATLGEVLVALALADDAAARLSRASGFTPGQVWDSPGLVNRVGTTLLTARLDHLGVDGARHALGLAVQHLGGTFQGVLDGSLAFKLVQGLSARDGVLACDLAAGGWTGGPDPLLGPIGYAEAFAAPVDTAELIDRLGQDVLGDEIFKPYPGCRFTHAAVDAALEIRPELQPDRVTEMIIEVAPMHAVPLLDRDPRAAATAQVGALFSLQYQVANALVRGRPRPEHFLAPQLHDPSVMALVDRAEVRGSLPADQITAAGLLVATADGHRQQAFVPTATGDPVHAPLTREAVETKFLDNLVLAGWSPARAGGLLEALMDSALSTPVRALTEGIGAEEAGQR